MYIVKAGLLLTAVACTAYSQALNCTALLGVPPYARAEGEAEPVGDVLLSCSGGTTSPSTPINVTVTLNTNLTSRTFATVPAVSEALLLIDEPRAGVVNTSNGFSYDGQVLGTPFVAAGSPGSGNVYQGQQVSPTSVSWSGIPFVAPGASGTRLLRITNIRANATTVAGNPLGQIDVTVSGTLPIGNPTGIVAFVTPGLIFSATVSTPSLAHFTFQENFATAFRKRIENTTVGPFTMAYQDFPGAAYNTESQFTPCLTPANCVAPPTGPLGRASSGTLLRAQMTKLGDRAGALNVPNRVLSSSGVLLANLIVFGKPVSGEGAYSLPVNNGSVDIVYEVAATAPFAGVTGDDEIDTFTMTGALFDNGGGQMAFPTTAVFTGHFAPISSITEASPTAPEPRFAP